MRDWWHELLKVADHNRGTLMAVAIVVAMAAYLLGCNATTGSLIDPGTSVTSRQLHAEIQHVEADLAKRRNLLTSEVANFNDDVIRFNESAEAAVADLESQEEVRRQIVQIVGGFAGDAAQGNFNPVSAISTLVTLITVGTAAGLAIDNRRKGSVIRLLKDSGDDKPAQ